MNKSNKNRLCKYKRKDKSLRRCRQIKYRQHCEDYGERKHRQEVRGLLNKGEYDLEYYFKRCKYSNPWSWD